ncbi:hypothetical protein SLEP1_g43747 [Rubroshorea leprosula]|uniref:Secreted protein n=1 Tax=Rubroshorea leprosula TaxID=152421 RepID=A0AAV5LF16_9ROSI|nr:hypothetical protein SLEP1_g43747 [Rubroshorea leprosula]
MLLCFVCLFAVSCSVRCRSGGLLSPPADLWRRAPGLPNLTPTAALLLVPRDYGRLIGLPPGAEQFYVWRAAITYRSSSGIFPSFTVQLQHSSTGVASAFSLLHGAAATIHGLIVERSSYGYAYCYNVLLDALFLEYSQYTMNMA